MQHRPSCPLPKHGCMHDPPSLLPPPLACMRSRNTTALSMLPPGAASLSSASFSWPTLSWRAPSSDLVPQKASKMCCTGRGGGEEGRGWGARAQGHGKGQRSSRRVREVRQVRFHHTCSSASSLPITKTSYDVPGCQAAPITLPRPCGRNNPPSATHLLEDGGKVAGVPFPRSLPVPDGLGHLSLLVQGGGDDDCLRQARLQQMVHPALLVALRQGGRMG